MARLDERRPRSRSRRRGCPAGARRRHRAGRPPRPCAGPATAVMFDTTSGIVVPTPSGVVRSTPNRDPTADRLGTMNTSLYVRSWLGFGCSIRMAGIRLTAPSRRPTLRIVTVPGGPRARLGWLVRVDVGAQRFHRPAGRRRPRRDRRRPARSRHRAEAARPGGLRRPDRPDRRGAARRPGRRGRVLARRADAAADCDRRPGAVPPPRARRDRPQRLRARRRGDGADRRRDRGRRPTPDDDNLARLFGQYARIEGNDAVALARRAAAARPRPDHTGRLAPRHVPGARRPRRSRLRPARRRARRRAPRRRATWRCATPTTSRHPSRSRSSTPRSTSSMPFPPDAADFGS